MSALQACFHVGLSCMGSYPHDQLARRRRRQRASIDSNLRHYRRFGEIEYNNAVFIFRTTKLGSFKNALAVLKDLLIDIGFCHE